jgi:hypothetical protein
LGKNILATQCKATAANSRFSQPPAGRQIANIYKPHAYFPQRNITLVQNNYFTKTKGGTLPEISRTLLQMRITENYISFLPMLIISILFSFLSVSCYYPKVNISKEEKETLVYPAKSNLLFSNKKGQIDTLKIYVESRRGFEPNLDFWWDKKIQKTDIKSAKRRFGKTFITYPNFENNKQKTSNINLSLRLNYTKNEKDNGIVLNIDQFRESYTLNKVLSDSLIFQDKISYNPKTCPENDYCVVRVIYHKKNGIVVVEKGNGEIWSLK